MGFLEPEQELALNLLTHVMWGNAGAHGPCIESLPHGRPAPCCWGRARLCSHTGVLSPRTKTHHPRQDWLLPSSSQVHI